VNGSIKKYGFIFIPFLLIFGPAAIIYKWPFAPFPDYLNIHGYSKIYELFNLIISSLVSLIGIYITVSLVAYEYFKQKSGIDFHKSFLINNANAYYISFSVFTIVFSFLCSIIISSLNPDDNQVGLIYFAIILFVIVILSLFIVAFNLFSSLKPEKLAASEILRLNKDSLLNVNVSANIDEEASAMENSPLVKVGNIVIALVSVSDNIKAQVVIQKLTHRMSTLILEAETSSKKEIVIDKLISFYIKIIDFSLLQPNNSPILGSIWLAIENMYLEAIKYKASSKSYEKFREKFIDRYFNRLIETNKAEIIQDGIITLRRIIENQVLFNTADESKIYYLDKLRGQINSGTDESENSIEINYDSAQQWQEIAIGMMGCFSNLISKSIKLNKPEIINKCFEQISELNFHLHLKKVGMAKESFFYLNSINITCDYAYRSFEKNVFSEGHEAHNITPSLFSQLILDQHPAARDLLTKYCYFLINLQKINKLDRHFLGGLNIGDIITTEGELGGIAKQCAINFKKGKVIQDCLKDCIDTFKILKEYYELNPPSDTGYYNVIKWQLENLLKWIEKAKVEEPVLKSNLSDLIASFKVLKKL
jgi:hypothetical protein